MIYRNGEIEFCNHPNNQQPLKDNQPIIQNKNHKTMNKTKFNTTLICSKINRHIYSMNYETEMRVRDYVTNYMEDEEKEIFPTYTDAKEIAEILGTNETCIEDILELND